MNELTRPKTRRIRTPYLVLGLLCLPATLGAQGAATPANSGQRTAAPPATAASAQPSGASSLTHGPQVNYAKLPLSFEPNQGQTDPRVKFLSRGRGYSLFLTGDGAVLEVQKAEGSRQKAVEKRPSSLLPGPLSTARDGGPGAKDKGPGTSDKGPMANGSALTMKLLNANASATAVGSDELPGNVNYFIGNDPKKWRTNIPTYAQVRYRDVYPGVDLVYHGNQDGRLEYDFVVAPGADASQIILGLDAAKEVGSRQQAVGSEQTGVGRGQKAVGGNQLTIDSNGNLVIVTDDGELVFRKPVVYQQQSEVRGPESGVQNETGNGKLEAGNSGNRKSPIRQKDGPSVENRKSVDGRFVLDAKNRLHFVLGPYDHSHPLVIDPELVYSTYLGGNKNDSGEGIAVDSSGCAYVTGLTGSSNFPTQDPYQSEKKGGITAFVTKMNSTGTGLVYSTFLGGSGTDYGLAIAVDSSGDAYVTGLTTSANFPTVNALQSSLAGSQNAFVTELNSTGSALVYSTYLGAGGSDSQQDVAGEVGTGIAVDSSNNVFVTGYTASTNFHTTTGALQTSLAGSVNAFVTELNWNGSSLSWVYSTYLGGNGVDLAFGIAIDSSDNAYVVGRTSSNNFPLVSPLQTSFNGYITAFIAKLNPTGSALVYSTYLGGSNFDQANAVAVDSAGNAYLTGETTSKNFPLRNPIQTSPPWGYYPTMAFVSKVNAAGSFLVYSTFLYGDVTYSGGDPYNGGFGIAVDSFGNAYVTGATETTNFPTVNPLPGQASLPGSGAGFLAVLNWGCPVLTYSTYLGGSYSDEASAIAVDSFGSAYLTGTAASTNFPTTSGAYQTELAGYGNAFVAKISNTAPFLCLAPTSLGFGNQPVGSSSGVLSIGLTNTGNAPLSVTDITISGNFSLTNTPSSCPYDGGTLAVSAICTVDVIFTPTSVGPLTGSVAINDNAFGNPQSVSLTGTGIAPLASVSRGGLLFSNQLVGTSSNSQSVFISDTGNAALAAGTIGISGDFTETDNCANTSVAAGSSCTINVTFTPTATGIRTGTLTITDNSNLVANSTQTVSLTGVGVAVGAVSVPSLNFGNQVVNTTSVPRTATFTNLGATALSNISIAASSPFAETNTCGASLAAMASCNIVITFTPTTLGAQNGAVTITYSGPNSPQPISLTGNGISAPPTSCPTDPQQARVNYGHLPLSFEANTGQTDPRVKFLSRGRGYGLFLTGDEAVLEMRKAERPLSLVAGPLSTARDGGPGAKDKGPETNDQGQVTKDSVLTMKLVGANPHAAVTGTDELPGKANYFIGNDPGKWVKSAPTYAQVRYQQVYPGIDLIYYGSQGGQLEYDFTVAPGADPSRILLSLDAGGEASGRRWAVGNGQEKRSSGKLRIDSGGDLVIPLEGGDEVRFHKPVVYQPQSTVDSSQLAGQDETANWKLKTGSWKSETGNSANRQSPIRQKDGPSVENRKSVEGSFVLDAQNRIHFALGPYDHTQPLIIDPVLVYSTYLGGSNNDGGLGIAVDSSCNAYVTGYTSSTDFPTAPTASEQESLGGPGNAFVSKLNSTGSALVYSTYLGGNGDNSGDVGFGIAVDSSGNAYVTGQTGSTNFPTASPLPPNGGTLGGACNAFVAELNAAGSALVYSTYLSGNDEECIDSGYAIAVDSQGDAYVAGQTDSTNFPTANPLQGKLGGTGADNAFVTELYWNGFGLSMVYSTYLGGSSYDSGMGITVDSSGYAYLTGYTSSGNFPTYPSTYPHGQNFNATGGASNTSGLAGKSNAFVSKLNPGGSALVYSTFLGGSSSDYGDGIAVDSSGDAYVTGTTSSSNFPTFNAYQSSLAGSNNAFVTELNAAGSALVYSTYLGGSGYDYGFGIAVDTSGNAYVAGQTNSPNFPTANPLPGGAALAADARCNAFVTQLKAAGSALGFSTYLGGSACDYASGIALDPFGNAYVTGYTSSSNFPTYPPNQNFSAGGAANNAGLAPGAGNAFVAEISLTGGPEASLSATSLAFGTQLLNTTSTAQTVTVTNTGTANLSILTATLGGTNSSDFAKSADTCTGATVAPTSTCTVSVTFTPTATGALSATLTFTDNNDAVASSTQVVNLSGAGGQPVASLSATSLTFGTQLLNTTSTAQTVTVTNTGTYNLSIATTTLGGTNSSDFAKSADTCTGATVAPSSTCTVSVTFKPSLVGSESASLNFPDNASGSPQTVALSGTGIGSLLTLSPSSLSFRPQIVGTTSKAQTITLTYEGNVTLTNINIETGGDFSQTHTCGSSLSGGTSCTISVTFKPKAPGAVTGTLLISDSAPGSPQRIALSGTGVAFSSGPKPPTPTKPPTTPGPGQTTNPATPLASLFASSLTFSPLTVGARSKALTLTLTNTGKAALAISGITTSGDFLQTNTCAGRVASGGSCTITVAFKPTATGARSGTLTLVDDSNGLAGTKQTVTLSGTGISEAVWRGRESPAAPPEPPTLPAPESPKP